MAGQVNNHNEKRKNWRLEYEQIIATLHNTEIIALGIVVFVIPLISWGLMLEPDSQTIFNKQDVETIGKISIGIWFFYLILSLAVYISKISKLKKRAKIIWKKLTDDKNDKNSEKKDQTTHIDILTSSNPLTYSLLLMLIGFVVCWLWIHKYPQIPVEILSLF